VLGLLEHGDLLGQGGVTDLHRITHETKLRLVRCGQCRNDGEADGGVDHLVQPVARMAHRALLLWRRETRATISPGSAVARSEEHTSELQSRFDLVCRLLLEKKKDISTL